MPSCEFDILDLNNEVMWNTYTTNIVYLSTLNLTRVEKILVWDILGESNYKNN